MASNRTDIDGQFTARNSRREYSCPVCLEEFQDPKVLPACNHSVCKQCLEKIVDRIIPATIQCPICRRDSLLEEREVDHLETNSSLVSELEQMNFEKEKERISKAIKSSRERVTTLEKLRKDFNTMKELRMKNAEQAKEEVKLSSTRLVDAIKKRESDLYRELDDAMNEQLKIYNTRQCEVESLLQRTKAFVSSAEDALDRGELINEAEETAESDLVEGRAHEELICYASMEIKFDPNKMVMVNVEKGGLGKIRVRDYASAKAAMYNGAVPLSPIPRPVDVLRTITPSDFGFESFSPLTIATDGHELLAVSDPENNNILLLDSRGHFLRRIVSASATPMMFSGVAFTKDKILIAVNGGRDVHYVNPQEGTFKVTYKGNSSSGLKYCFLTADAEGRILLTCEPSTKTSRPCIVVYSDAPLGDPDLTLGGGIQGNGSLLFPFKAWFLKGKYFVSDMEKGCIMVYDEEGKFARHFGGKDAKVTGPGNAGQLVLPTGTAPHPHNDTLLVCDWGSSSVQIYTLDGAFIDVFPVGGRPTDIAIFDDGTIFVSSKDDQWIKILSPFYT